MTYPLCGMLIIFGRSYEPVGVPFGDGSYTRGPEVLISCVIIPFEIGSLHDSGFLSQAIARQLDF